MSWYKEYHSQWKEIIETVAKGGTSLSKAYNLIDCFSEDIDLSMNRKPTESERKTAKELIVSIAGSLGMTLMNQDQLLSDSISSRET